MRRSLTTSQPDKMGLARAWRGLPVPTRLEAAAATAAAVATAAAAAAAIAAAFNEKR